MSLQNIYVNQENADLRQSDLTIQSYVTTNKSRLRSMMKNHHAQAASAASLSKQQQLKSTLRRTRNPDQQIDMPNQQQSELSIKK